MDKTAKAILLKTTGILFFGVVILSVSLVLAAVFFSSDGSTFKGVDEDVSNVYNFTVENTDVTDAANITEVNITVPSSFTITANTNGTTANGLLTISSTVLSWLNNSGLIANQTNHTFYFNATAATPGNYNITVLARNETTTTETNISIEVNDTTNPSVTLTKSSSTKTTLKIDVGISDDSTISGTCSFDRPDASITAGSGTSSQTLEESGLLCGTSYSYKVTCTDSAGNSGSSSATSFSTDACSSSSGGVTIPAPEWTNTFTYDDAEFSEKGALTREYSAKHRVKVKLNGLSHYVGVKSLTATTATIEVASDPQTATLDVGETRTFDVGEGNYELSVALNSITNSKASLTVKSVIKVAEEEESGEGLPPSSEKEAGQGLSKGVIAMIIIIIAVIVIAIGYAKYAKPKR